MQRTKFCKNNKASQLQVHTKEIQARRKANPNLNSILNANSSLVMSIFSVLFLMNLIQLGSALRCYEIDERGKLGLKSKEEWKYCVMIPAMRFGSHATNASQFGIGIENENLSIYDTAFSMDVRGEYRMLSVCVFEEYNFRKYFNSPTEYMLRCVCNFDYCNRRDTFGPYLTFLHDAALYQSYIQGY